MFSRVNGIGISGISSYMIEIEADVSNGLPAFDIVGIPDVAVKESRDRVRSAIKNCGFKFPVGRITVNLAPANRKKEGSLYDLPVLLSILKASGQLKCDFADTVAIGEVALDGMIREVNGVLAIVITAKEYGVDTTLFFELQENGKWMVYDMSMANVQEPIVQVRLTFCNDETVLASGFVESNASTITAPVISAPEGQVFVGWFIKTVDEKGQPVMNMVFAPGEDGVIQVPYGTTLEPLTLYAVFENI